MENRAAVESVGMLCLVVFLVAGVAGNGEVAFGQEELTPEGHREVVAELTRSLRSDDIDQRNKAIEELQKLCHDVARPGNEPERKSVCAELAAVMGTDLSGPAVLWILKSLESVGRDEVVDATAKLLRHNNSNVREGARRALEHNPAKAATNALRKDLERPGNGAWRAAVINSLGRRKDSEGADLFRRFAESSHIDTRLAAIHALVRIGDESAVDIIVRNVKSSSKRVRNGAIDAYLLLADNLTEKNSKAEALAIYRELLNQERHVKCAAIIGLGRAGGPSDIPVIMDMLADGDSQVRGACARALTFLPGVDVAGAVSRRFETAGPGEKVSLLRVLAQNNRSESLPVFVSAVDDPAAAVRIAAIEGLQALGDASTVTLLVKALSAEDSGERDAARKTLALLQGDGVDGKVAGALNGAGTEAKVALISILAARKYQPAVPALIKTAVDREKKVRIGSFRALAGLARATDIPKLVELLAKIEGGPSLREAEKAITTTCLRIEDPDHRVAHLVAGFRNAPEGTRCSVLRVLGSVGGGKALGLVREAIEDENDEVREAAVRSIVDWPDAEAAPDLLNLARNAEKEIHRILALRGYVRVAALPSGLSSKDIFGMYEQAMALAARTDEKKLVLSKLGDVPGSESLAMAVRHMEEPELVEEATLAVVKIAQTIGPMDTAGAKKALEKVIETCETESIRKNAQEAIAAFEKYEGYITAWMISGPYTAKGKDGPKLIGVEFPPEKPGSADVKWQPMTGSLHAGGYWIVDIETVFDGDHRAAYLRTSVHSPEAQEARIELGSDDGVKLWLNGRKVHENNASRALKPAEDIVEVSLMKGANPMLFKITQGTGEWSMCARLRSPDGFRLEYPVSVTAE